MTTIYVILGIIGWTAAAVAIPLYIWSGYQPTPTAPRSNPNTNDNAT